MPVKNITRNDASLGANERKSMFNIINSATKLPGNMMLLK